MTIFVTGDVHGRVQERLGVRNFPEQRELLEGEDHFVIVLGDFGLIWDQDRSREENYLCRWLDEKPFYTLFVDGNHENHDRLDNFPVSNKWGGKVQQISEKVFHLMRGEVYDIAGKRLFVFGGAESHDLDNLLDPVGDPRWKRKQKRLNKEYQSYRIIGKSWWAREQASEQEKENGISNLDKSGWKVDYVLTHTPPAGMLFEIFNGTYQPDNTALYLEDIRKKLDFQLWLSGHIHEEHKTSSGLTLHTSILDLAEL